MVLFSKIKPITHISRRNFRFPNYGQERNPTIRYEEFCAEPHAEHCVLPTKICLFFIIPLLTAYAGYREYMHMIAHPHREPWPRQFFLNAAEKPWPFEESGKSFFHHPFYNFIARKGYETDEHGNPLPPGQYSEK